MAKFNLVELLNSKSKTIPELTPEKPGAGEQFETHLISVHKLRPSKNNFYNVTEVDDLKDSIKMVGLKQNIIAAPITDTDEYEIIAGHRRRLAILKLIEEGEGQLEFVPCRIERDLDETEKKLILILTNSTTRQLTDWERVLQIDQLKILLQEYKKTHDLPGRIRELLADTLDMSFSQVARIESINDNLVPELKEELKQGNIGFSAAAEASRLSVADQKAVYEKHKETGQTNLKTVQTIREKKVETTQPAPTPATPPAQPEQEPQTVTIIDEMEELLNSLVKIRGQYKHLINIPAGEKALKALETLNALIYDDIEAIKADVLGEPLFTENGGGTNEC